MKDFCDFQEWEEEEEHCDDVCDVNLKFLGGNLKKFRKAMGNSRKQKINYRIKSKKFGQ